VNEPLVQLNWRTVLAMSLVVIAGLLHLSAPDGAVQDQVVISDSSWHANAQAGFRIQPPPGWHKRVDDPDGSRISPADRPADGFAWLIVSTHMARQSDPKRVLEAMTLQPAGGPVVDLVWHPPERIALGGGGDAAIARFTQTYQGVALQGQMLVVVDGGRQVQAVGVLPAGRDGKDVLQLEAAIRSLQLF